MTNASDRQAETERQIRERLEQTGQLGAMRAMIVEAALQSLARDQPADTKAVALFHPSPALQEAKASADGGRGSLGAIYAQLTRLGLQYTAKVLALETGIAAEELEAAGGHGAATTAAAAVPVPLVGGAARPAAPAVAAPYGAYAAAKAVAPQEEEEGEGEESGVDSSSGSEAASDSSAQGEKEEAPLPGAEDTTYFISKWRRKTFTRVNQVAGQQLQVEYLTDCNVVVLDPLDSMTVDDCEGGQLVIAACEGSVFLRNCKNMTVHVACKQLRTRDCEGIDLRILTTTDPVVEMSHHMTFRPFHLRLPHLVQSLKDARLDAATNRFVHVYDFTADEPGLPQPHYTVLYPNHGVAMEDRCGEHGTPECPPAVEDLLTGKLLPAASSESGQNKSYDIKTGSAAWAAAAAAGTTGEEASDEEEEEEVEEEEEEEESEEGSDDGEEVAGGAKPTAAAAAVPSAIPVPTAGGGRPPAAPAPVPSLGGPKLGNLDDQEYSSFDESSEEEVNEDDKYDIDEDDDDF